LAKQAIIGRIYQALSSYTFVPAGGCQQFMEHDMEPIFVSIHEAAEALSIGRTSLYELIKDGTLETRKMGRRRLVLAASLRRLAGEQD
jgi:excisionase family DNA binding protein